MRSSSTSSSTTPPRPAPDGPAISFRGLANDDYYLLDADGGYIDDSGCGNTLNANGPIVRRLIIDSLRYWVQEMHVDGFRFDLAAVLSRDRLGNQMADPPILWEIETDPVMAGTKLIAEAWDAGGLYQVGSFVGDRWSEWNGRFRDDVRAFVKGDRGTVQAVSQRFLGSPDIYGHKNREPGASINFVTCHDGFTLNDLVSYDRKHNEANGEANRDGSDGNLSWNCGVEGPTDDPAIEALRRRQIKNLLVFDLLSLGAPMLLMGDEIRRTQGGNNNGYGLDDPTSWFDWTGLERHADILRFTQGLISIRRRIRTILDVPPEMGLLDLLKDASIEWSGIEVGKPDLGDDSHSIAMTMRSEGGAIHLIFNAWWEPLAFELPPPGDSRAGWRRIIDTNLVSPDDLIDGHRRRRADRRLDLHGAAAVDRPPCRRDHSMTGAERKRMADAGHPEEGWTEASPWYQWGPYLSERAWGGVREDYSANGDAWTSFPHDHARSRAYRWNEDGMAGISDVFNRLCLGLALWNGKDPIIKERMFGLTNSEGNHGEDVKEYWWFLDALPSSAWLRWRYHYPQAAYPYEDLIEENGRRSKLEPEYELIDTGIFDDDRYWIVEVHYAKADPTDILMRVVVRNQGPEAATLHVLPHLWFRNEWAFDPSVERPVLQREPGWLGDPGQARPPRRLHPPRGARRLTARGRPCCSARTRPTSRGSTAPRRRRPCPKDGINDHVTTGSRRSTRTRPARRQPPGTRSRSRPASRPSSGSG